MIFCLRRFKHHRQALGYTRPGDAVKPRQLLAQHLFVKKQQRTLRLILRRRRHVTLAGEVAQEPLDMDGRQLRWVPLAKINDVAFNPIDIGLLGADLIVLDADAVAHLIEQAARLQTGSGWVQRRRDGFHGF